MILAIETSCDETAVAILDDSKDLRFVDAPETLLKADIISSQTKLHQAYGGVVPELAAREHLLSLPILVNEALQQAGIGYEALTKVAVTQGPGLNGCLLVGLCYAKALAFDRKVPLIPLNHLEGHIFSADLLPRAERPEFPMLVLLVSGGHTFLLFVREFRQYELVAQTLDDSVGEAFDKTASLLGLPYPGGPQLAAAAIHGNHLAYPFPVGVKFDQSSFSFSGLKTAVLRTVKSLGTDAQKQENVANLAASIQYALLRPLVDKTLEAADRLHPRSVLLTGGVAANLELRLSLSEALQIRNISFCVPPARWCTDNAAMIAALASRVVYDDSELFRNWMQRAKSDTTLGPGAGTDLTARPRWPIVNTLEVNPLKREGP